MLNIVCAKYYSYKAKYSNTAWGKLYRFVLNIETQLYGKLYRFVLNIVTAKYPVCAKYSNVTQLNIASQLSIVTIVLFMLLY